MRICEAYVLASVINATFAAFLAAMETVVRVAGLVATTKAVWNVRFAAEIATASAGNKP
jgi:hypothetical protein